MELHVTVQLDGMDVPCGTLYTNVRRGQQSASFVYDRSYILRKDAFEISPDLPLGEATVHTTGKPLFLAFEDCMPGRWGAQPHVACGAKSSAGEEAHGTLTLGG